jgi:glycine cleavage system H protein
MPSWKTVDNAKYAKSDEWVLLDGDTASIGISDYAQDQLNDIVYVELPEVGREIKKGEEFGSVESVKAASPLVSPISGTISEVNKGLEDEPELINADPFGKGWIVKLKVSNPSELNDLMDAAAYASFCESR